jgi:hypothetical protein
MDIQASQKLPIRKASRIRKALLAFLALTYLFVGLAHTVTCTDEAVALALVSDVGTDSGGPPDEGGSKKSPLFAEHCYVCAPVLISALVPVAAPSAQALKIALIAPTVSLAEHPRLDTPPPKG